MKNQGSGVRGEPAVPPRGGVLEPTPRPTADEMYLLHKINERTEGRDLTPGNVYGWNRKYGVGVVTSVLRTLHGFPPETTITSPFAYVSKVLAATEGEP